MRGSSQKAFSSNIHFVCAILGSSFRMFVVYTKHPPRRAHVTKWKGRDVGNLTYIRPVEVPVDNSWILTCPSDTKFGPGSLSIEYVTDLGSLGPFDFYLPYDSFDPEFHLQWNAKAIPAQWKTVTTPFTTLASCGSWENVGMAKFTRASEVFPFFLCVML